MDYSSDQKRNSSAYSYTSPSGGKSGGNVTSRYPFADNANSGDNNNKRSFGRSSSSCSSSSSASSHEHEDTSDYPEVPVSHRSESVRRGSAGSERFDDEQDNIASKRKNEIKSNNLWQNFGLGGASSSAEKAPLNKEKSSRSRGNNNDRDTPASDVTTVNHNFTQQKPKRSILGMTRPVFACLAVAAVAAILMGAYSLYKLPPLRSQVKDLEEQVDRLQHQVDLIEAQNERFNNSNNAMNNSILEFERQNIYLNETSKRLRQSLHDLRHQLHYLEGETQALTFMVGELRKEVDALNATVFPIQQHAQALEDHVIALLSDHASLQAHHDSLQSSIVALQEHNAQLRDSRDGLVAVQPSLNASIAVLRAQLDELQAVRDFLAGSTQDISQELQDKAHTTATQVTRNRGLGMTDLKTKDLDVVHGWDCALSKSFPNLFQQNADAALGNATAAVLDFVHQHLLAPLCLSQTDFGNYIVTEYRNDVTMNELLEGANAYTESGLDFYYDGVHVTHDEWEAASFNCNDIPTPFVYEYP